jgi:hypothetical protein
MNKECLDRLKEEGIDVVMETPTRAVICKEGRFYQFLEGSDLDSLAVLNGTLNKMYAKDKNYAWVNGSGAFIEFVKELTRQTGNTANGDMILKFKQMME